MLNRSSFYRPLIPTGTTLSGSTPNSGSSVNLLSQSNPVNAYYPKSLDVVVQVGAVSGSPSSFQVAVQVQTSPDNSTWTNVGTHYYEWEQTADAIPDDVSLEDVTSAGVTALHLDAEGLLQYVQAVATPSFVGGTSPSVPVAVLAHFSKPDFAPVS